MYIYQRYKSHPMSQSRSSLKIKLQRKLNLHSINDFQGDTEVRGCNAKSGNPFGPFWDNFKVDFVKSVTYGPLHYDVHHTSVADEWTEKFPGELVWLDDICSKLCNETYWHVTHCHNILSCFVSSCHIMLFCRMMILYRHLSF